MASVEINLNIMKNQPLISITVRYVSSSFFFNAGITKSNHISSLNRCGVAASTSMFSDGQSLKVRMRTAFQWLFSILLQAATVAAPQPARGRRLFRLATKLFWL